MHLPKGTEHFLSDIHGEYDAFSHVLRNGSGAVRKKIEDVFGDPLSDADKAALATLIYYPKKKMELVKKSEKDMESWYKNTLYHLIEVCKTVSSKYTRSCERLCFIILCNRRINYGKQEVCYYEAIVNTGGVGKNRKILFLWPN